MHLATWCRVTYFWYQITKECSKIQARIIVIMTQRVLKSLTVEHTLGYWYPQCVTVQHELKPMSYHEVTGELSKTGRVYCLSFRLHICICIYCTHLLSVGFEHSVLDESLLISFLYIYIYTYILIFIVSVNCVTSPLKWLMYLTNLGLYR